MAKTLNNREEGKKSLLSGRQRGTNDDVEIIVMILKENLPIRLKVMEKIKQAKVRISMRSSKESGAAS